MRLSDQQRQIIVTGVANIFGPNAAVWLFGSRADDARRGGDIDLLIRTDNPDIEANNRAEIALLTWLYQQLGEQKIDILLDYPNWLQRPLILDIAQREGIRL